MHAGVEYLDTDGLTTLTAAATHNITDFYVGIAKLDPMVPWSLRLLKLVQGKALIGKLCPRRQEYLACGAATEVSCWWRGEPYVKFAQREKRRRAAPAGPGWGRCST